MFQVHRCRLSYVGPHVWSLSAFAHYHVCLVCHLYGCPCRNLRGSEDIHVSICLCVLACVCMCSHMLAFTCVCSFVYSLPWSISLLFWLSSLRQCFPIISVHILSLWVSTFENNSCPHICMSLSTSSEISYPAATLLKLSFVCFHHPPPLSLPNDMQHMWIPKATQRHHFFLQISTELPLDNVSKYDN